MRKWLYIVVCLVSMSSLSTAADFNWWFPWLYRHAITSSNAWTWITANSNVVDYVEAHSNEWDDAWDWVEANSNNTGHAELGIWCMNYSLEISPMPLYVLTTEAGLWRLNTNAEIVVSSNNWTDSFWETNGIGEIVTRDVP